MLLEYIVLKIISHFCASSLLPRYEHFIIHLEKLVRWSGGTPSATVSFDGEYENQ